jgi:LysM domain
MIAFDRCAAFVVPLVLLIPASARGQMAPTAPPAVGAVAAAPAATPQPGSTYVPAGGGFGNPQSPNGTIGGGNATESSSHPVTGEAEDSFDLGRRSEGEGAAHGDQNGPVFATAVSIGSAGPTGELPAAHIVRRGDTLWGICDNYFKNAYEWPRVWSYNPQIKNPNWIYPGDEVKLSAGGGDVATAANPAGLPSTPAQMNMIDRRRRVPNDTVFLRDQGWIRDEADEVWGEITGAAEDKMLLSDADEVYLHVDEGHDVKLGQELTIFRPVHPTSSGGTIVQIEGTVRIDQWNSRDRVARAKLVESLNVIERGARVGALARSFEIVPPRRNDDDVEAHVLASVHPNEFYGQNQVVFIDKGESAGLKVGNRLFVVRRGDPWQQSLVEPSAGYRVSPDDDKPLPPMENTPRSRRDEHHYPDEVVGELRVVSLRKDTATCIVTQSTVEIERHDSAVARKGY